MKVLVHNYKERVIGACTIQYALQQGEDGAPYFYIHNIKVPESKTGSGQARKALNTFIKECGGLRVVLHAAPKNESYLSRIQNFYASLGFKHTGRFWMHYPEMELT